MSDTALSPVSIAPNLVKHKPADIDAIIDVIRRTAAERGADVTLHDVQDLRSAAAERLTFGDTLLHQEVMPGCILIHARNANKPFLVIRIHLKQTVCIHSNDDAVSEIIGYKDVALTPSMVMATDGPRMANKNPACLFAKHAETALHIAALETLTFITTMPESGIGELSNLVELPSAQVPITPMRTDAGAPLRSLSPTSTCLTQWTADRLTVPPPAHIDPMGSDQIARCEKMFGRIIKKAFSVTTPDDSVLYYAGEQAQTSAAIYMRRLVVVDGKPELGFIETDNGSEKYIAMLMRSIVATRRLVFIETEKNDQSH